VEKLDSWEANVEERGLYLDSFGTRGERLVVSASWQRKFKPRNHFQEGIVDI